MVATAPPMTPVRWWMVLQSLALSERASMPLPPCVSAMPVSCCRPSGDLLSTGPTGTNVMDLMLGLKLAPDNDQI